MHGELKPGTLVFSNLPVISWFFHLEASEAPVIQSFRKDTYILVYSPVQSLNQDLADMVCRPLVPDASTYP